MLVFEVQNFFFFASRLAAAAAVGIEGNKTSLFPPSPTLSFPLCDPSSDAREFSLVCQRGCRGKAAKTLAPSTSIETMTEAFDTLNLAAALDDIKFSRSTTNPKTLNEISRTTRSCRSLSSRGPVLVEAHRILGLQGLERALPLAECEPSARGARGRLSKGARESTEGEISSRWPRPS